jgi:hypothetical protein
MAEPHHVKGAPRRTIKNERRVPTTVMILAFIFVAGIGYVAGAINVGAIKSFGGLLGYGENVRFGKI